jgi:hypothetical protein
MGESMPQPDLADIVAAMRDGLDRLYLTSINRIAELTEENERLRTELAKAQRKPVPEGKQRRSNILAEIGE